MPRTKCENCGNSNYTWNWEEAFDKFGFGDGDGQIQTWEVENVLTSEGYTVFSDYWGMHNEIIRSIKKDGKELIPDDADLGYDDPRNYLPHEIINLLDEKLP